LRDFPLDTQELKFRIQSYSLPADLLQLRWRAVAPLDPLPTGLSNSVWTVVDQQTSEQNVTFRRRQQFSMLIARIFVKRQTTQHSLKFIFPMSLLVFLR
jgi:hypothetical protein